MSDREQRPEPDVRYRFAHEPGAGNQARRRLDELLIKPGDVIADDVRLAASELVTNVVVHTDGGGEMRAWDPRPDVPLRVEVEDGNPAPPLIPVEAPEVGGRGLAIVDAVSDEWGFEPKPDGKVVWAEFDRSKRTPDEPPPADDQAHGVRTSDQDEPC